MSISWMRVEWFGFSQWRALRANKGAPADLCTTQHRANFVGIISVTDKVSRMDRYAAGTPLPNASPNAEVHASHICIFCGLIDSQRFSK